MRTTWTTLIHGEEKSGKSRLANTAPAPRVIFDVEGRAQFLPGRKVYWDVLAGGPPRYDGTWETCVAPIGSFDASNVGWQWLRDGSQHDFVSFTLDSVMELQTRCVDKIVPDARALDQGNFGELLRLVEKQIRQFRDLRHVSNNPLSAFIFVSGSIYDDHRGWQPYLQGQINKKIGYYFDTIGFLYKQAQADGTFMRSLLIDKQPGFVAGDGTDKLVKHYGPIVRLPDDEPHLANFMAVLSADDEQGGTTA